MSISNPADYQMTEVWFCLWLVSFSLLLRSFFLADFTLSTCHTLRVFRVHETRNILFRRRRRYKCIKYMYKIQKTNYVSNSYTFSSYKILLFLLSELSTLYNVRFVVEFIMYLNVKRICTESVRFFLSPHYSLYFHSSSFLSFRSRKFMASAAYTIYYTSLYILLPVIACHSSPYSRRNSPYRQIKLESLTQHAGNRCIYLYL